MKIVRLVIIISLSVILASCCACRKRVSDGRALTDTRWTLIEMNGAPFKANDNFYIEFNGTEGRMNGRGDCNSVMGSYKVTPEGKIDFESMASTRAMCHDQDNESKFIKLLDESDSYRIDGNLLMLFDDGELKLILESK